MKIIKKGKPPAEATRIWTCNKCESILEARESEIKHKVGPFCESYSQVKCPVCSNKQHL